MPPSPSTVGGGSAWQNGSPTAVPSSGASSGELAGAVAVSESSPSSGGASGITNSSLVEVDVGASENAEKREIVDRRTYGHMCKSAHEWVCEQYRKTVRPGSHTAGVTGRLWSEVAVASLKHRWDNRMRLPDENGGKDRRGSQCDDQDDLGGQGETTGRGATRCTHHRRILEGEKKRGMRGPATRSAFWGCRACKAAMGEAAKEEREARRRIL